MARFDSINEYLDALDERIENFEEAIFLSASSVSTQILERIFEKGQDINGQTFKYRPLSVKLRKEAGRQTSFVDFKFTGELQSELRTSAGKPLIEKVSDGVYRLDVNRSANVEKLRDFQNKFNGKFSDVFEISEKEADEFARILENEIIFQLNGI